MRFRHWFMTFGSLAVMTLWVLTDPDLGLIQNLSFGAALVATLVIMTKGVLYVTLLHLSRKGLFDYLDFQKIAERAMQSSEGAGKLAISLGLAMIAIAIVIVGAAYA